MIVKIVQIALDLLEIFCWSS